MWFLLMKKIIEKKNNQTFHTSLAIVGYAEIHDLLLAFTWI